ncbi:MAG: WG repeat-containing protein, partial [Tannerellaceae bacterium]|nr:WG repeat-containing protein [Tannerellaceae bacterium]
FLYCSTIFSLQSQTLIAKEKKHKYGYVDSAGKVKIPYEYSFVFTDTLETIAFVSQKGKIKAIDRNNNRLFTVFNYDNGPDYESEGLFRIIDDNNDRIGFADSQGQIIIQPAYFFVQPFSEGMAAFNEGGKKEALSSLENYSQIVGGKWGYINKQGIIVFPAIFDKAMPFKNQKAEVEIEGYTFYIQKQ